MPDKRLLAEIAQLAVPDNENDSAIAMYAGALKHGRRIKVSTRKILELSTDPNISAITAMEVEEALGRVQVEDGR